MYYIYQHIRLDKNEIFYIGISRHNKNFKYKRAAQKDTRNPIWKHIVAKTDYRYEIILESEDLDFIKAKEIELIAKYGKIKYNTGTLANIADGGEGAFGVIPSKEVLEGRRLRMKGKKLSEETKIKMSKAQLGKTISKETGEKISTSKKGKNLGKTTENKPLKIIHIPTNTIYRSITKAAKHFNIRRNTLSNRLYSDLEKEFKFYN